MKHLNFTRPGHSKSEKKSKSKHGKETVAKSKHNLECWNLLLQWSLCFIRVQQSGHNWRKLPNLTSTKPWVAWVLLLLLCWWLLLRWLLLRWLLWWRHLRLLLLEVVSGWSGAGRCRCRLLSLWSTSTCRCLSCKRGRSQQMKTRQLDSQKKDDTAYDATEKD